MRILVVSNLFPPDVIGGYELQCAHAVDALRARGHRVVVATTGRRRTHEIDVERVMRLAPVYDEELGYHPVTSRHIKSRAAIIDGANARALLELVDAYDPDVVYFWNLLGLGALGLLYAVQHAGYPWVIHLCDRMFEHLFLLAGPVGALSSVTNKYLKGTYIAISSRTVLDAEMAGIELPPERTVLLPTWVYGPQYKRTSADDGVLRAAFVGRISRDKGADIAIEAMGVITAGRGPVATLDMYGSVIEGDILGLIRELGLENLVRVDQVTAGADVMRLLAAHDVLLVPSDSRDANPVTPLEAAHQGCIPIISWDTGISEWLVDGVHCLKADRSPEGFASRLVDILDAAVDVDGLRRRGASVVARDFHVDRAIVAVEAVLARTANIGTTQKRTHESALLAEIADDLLAWAVDINA